MTANDVCRRLAKFHGQLTIFATPPLWTLPNSLLRHILSFMHIYEWRGPHRLCQEMGFMRELWKKPFVLSQDPLIYVTRCDEANMLPHMIRHYRTLAHMMGNRPGYLLSRIHVVDYDDIKIADHIARSFMRKKYRRIQAHCSRCGRTESQDMFPSNESSPH